MALRTKGQFISFLHLPIEISHPILRLIVQVRGVTRSIRLRRICRFFAAAIVEVLFESGLLDGTRLEQNIPPAGGPFWSSYLAYRVLSSPDPLTLPMQKIRRLAEHLVRNRHRGEIIAVDVDVREEMETTVRKICALWVQDGHFFEYARHFLLPKHNSPPTALLEPDNFYTPLLVVAAFTGDTALLRDLVGQGYGQAFKTSSAPFNRLVAGLCTNLRAISLLFGPGCLPRDARTEKTYWTQRALQKAAEAGNAEIVGFLLTGLDPPIVLRNEASRLIVSHLEKAAFSTRNLRIFKRLYEFVEHSTHGKAASAAQDERLWTYLRFVSGYGELDLMKFLIRDLGVSVDGSKEVEVPTSTTFLRPISAAAAAGRFNAVELLLLNGAEPSISLVAAADFGSERIVRLLMKHGAGRDEDVVQTAFLRAVERENLGALYTLVEFGERPSKRTLDGQLDE